MKVSVIISVYNAEDIIDITLPKFLNQNYPKDKLDLIIVNDASTDNSYNLLKKYNLNNNFNLINHKRNKGRCATRNSGINNASGDLIIFVDCDIEVEKNFVLFHAAFHENENIIGLLSNVKPIKYKNQSKYHKFLSRKKRGAKSFGNQIPIPFKYFIFTATSVKKFAIDKTGLLDENLKGYGIDLHYSYRLWKYFPENLFFESSIIVNQHKLKNFDQALFDFKDYGKRNLPIVLKSFPELSKDLGVSLFQKNSFFSMIIRNLIFNDLIKILTNFLIKFLPPSFCYPFIKFRMLIELLSGFKQKQP